MPRTIGTVIRYGDTPLQRNVPMSPKRERCGRREDDGAVAMVLPKVLWAYDAVIEGIL
jgi:hypothetical protein